MIKSQEKPKRGNKKDEFQLYAAAAKSLQSCPTLCDPTDGSPPGSPIPGILQARVLEWGAIAFSGLYLQGPADLCSPRKSTEIFN